MALRVEVTLAGHCMHLHCPSMLVSSVQCQTQGSIGGAPPDSSSAIFDVRHLLRETSFKLTETCKSANHRGWGGSTQVGFGRAGECFNFCTIPMYTPAFLKKMSWNKLLGFHLLAGMIWPLCDPLTLQHMIEGAHNRTELACNHCLENGYLRLLWVHW